MPCTELTVASRLLKRKRTAMNCFHAAQNWAVVVFDTHVEAEETVECLCQAGFDTARLSVAGREYHSPGRVIGCYGEGGRAVHRGDSGAFWSRLWERLPGWAFLAARKCEVIVIAGPLANSVVAALDNGPIFGGLSPLGAGLYNLGIPKDAVRAYEEALETGKFLVIANGTARELAAVGTALHEVEALAGNGPENG